MGKSGTRRAVGAVTTLACLLLLLAVTGCSSFGLSSSTGAAISENRSSDTGATRPYVDPIVNIAVFLLRRLRPLPAPYV